MATFRTKALNRGSNWRQMMIQVNELEKLMQLIEFKSFNLQSELSAGITNSSAIVNVGTSYSLDKNGTGKQGTTIDTSAPFTWRWRENEYYTADKSSWCLYRTSGAFNSENKAVSLLVNISDSSSASYNDLGSVLVYLPLN